MSSSTNFSSFWLLTLASLSQVAADAPVVNDAQCNCFKTNGSDVSYFANHRFYDFRQLQQYQGVPDPLSGMAATRNAPVTSQYFNADAWSNVWGIQSWNNSDSVGKDATVLMINSPNNVYIEENTDAVPSSATWMTMRTVRLPGFQSAAEIESTSSGYQFLSLRMLARTVGSPGACTAMFTYRAADNLADIQEADLEVRTRDPRNSVQYTNQPSYTTDGKVIDQSTQNATVPLDWSEWAVHRLDWTPRRSTWFVDGAQVASIAFQTPRDPSQVIFNSWSDGGVWTGNMSVYDAAYMQIQWLEMVYNTTDSAQNSSSSEASGGDGGNGGNGISSRDAAHESDHVGPFGSLTRKRGNDQCRVVCSIDDSAKTGAAVMLWNSTAPGTLLGQREGSILSWMPTLLMLGIFMTWTSDVRLWRS